MDHKLLLDITCELGYRLAMNGAETFRVEESICRIMNTYGIKAEVSAVPSCIHVSIEDEDGTPLTRMRRIENQTNNLDSVEKYNALSRRICAQRPSPQEIKTWLDETEKTRKHYPTIINLIGSFLVGCGFTLLFGGHVLDCLCGGLCGLITGVASMVMQRWKINQFFQTIASAFLLAMAAYAVATTGIITSVDAAIIGPLMLLVPGLLFTNAMRDIIFGDTNSGTNRIVQTLLIAAGIALGTGAALNLANALWDIPTSISITDLSLTREILACFIGGIGFTFLFNIHGKGAILCAIGGVITWVTYRLTSHFTGDIAAYLIATMISALYSEIMARIRKYPAISYLVISIIPLLPGAGIYYTMQHAVRGDMSSFANEGTYTIAIAGAMAVGILMISTIYRLINVLHHKK